MTWQGSIIFCCHLLVIIICHLERMIVFQFHCNQIYTSKPLWWGFQHKLLTKTKGTKHVAIHEKGKQSAGDGGFNVHPSIQAGGILSS